MLRFPPSALRCLLAASALVAATASGAAEPKRGGTLSIGLAQDPAIVDPIRTGTFTERQLSTPVYEALFDIDPKGNAVPFLAESFTVSDDLKTWRIKLRPGVKFHDGTPLDAAAVAANFERTANPANRCRCLVQMTDFKEWKVIDPLTVEIVLTGANAGLPTILADAPGIMVSPTAFKADPQGVGTKPVGTGPFKFVEWVRNSRFVVERNPDYWQKGKPYLDKLVFRGMQNSETREAAFKSGQTDIILQPSMHFISTMKTDKRHVVLSPAGFGSEGVYLNAKKAPLDDIRVRWAVAHAIDRDLLNRTLGFGVPTPAYSPFGRGMATIKQPVDVYPKYDPAKAKALLAEYGKPVAFTLSYNNTPETRHQVQSLQEMWAQVGIKAELVPLDQNRLVQNMSSKQFEASIYRYTGRADPDSNTYGFFHSRSAEINPSSNYGGYASKAVDDLLEQGRATADPAKRAAVYSDLARVLVKEVMPYAYLNTVTDTIVIKPYVKDLTVVPDGLVRFAAMWRQ
ncbi:ABC transporter substrate-binding protein [Pseudorhodoferax sp.]|uniref:ABC transporter substrate-binding protein n=1 Tax=Pseudorhodoferax sp. TaxID=1993553 RepID=UPI002DD69758|nr:ABC transporter substrate-binding protein [Pseudorhodoferax sp.]